MKTIHLIIGTRPEAVKMAPVFKALQQKSDLRVRLISTGQHRELLRQVLTEFELTPDHDLNVMTPGQSLSRLTANLLVGLEGLFSHERPNAILAHGDTTTCYTSALSSFYHSIPFFHVEAGLRTFRLDSPYPEEFNRQCVSRMAVHHFAPSESAKQNLILEGVDQESISVTGSTVYDAIRLMDGRTNDSNGIQKKLGCFKRSALFTLHRRENSASSLEGVMGAVQMAATRHPDTAFIFPVHPNPSVKSMAHSIFSRGSNVLLTEPLSYPTFLSLLKKSSLVLTDSGGVQEEAAYFGKPALVLRDTTERNDGFNQGTTKVIGTNPETIIAQIATELAKVSVQAKTGKISEKSASQIIAETVHKKCDERCSV